MPDDGAAAVAGADVGHGAADGREPGTHGQGAPDLSGSPEVPSASSAAGDTADSAGEGASSARDARSADSAPGDGEGVGADLVAEDVRPEGEDVASGEAGPGATGVAGPVWAPLPGPEVDDVPDGPGSAGPGPEREEPGTDDPPAGGTAGEAQAPRRTGWAALGAALRPELTRSQGLAALLCGLLGFALVVQVQQSAQDPLSSARQDDLVRLLDEVTQRSERLSDEVADLTRTRDELASGTGQAQAALDLAEQRAASEGILSGRLPAVGPGIEIVVRDPQGVLEAAKLFNVLEELRNAGAEVVELNGVRLVTSTWFLDGDAGVVVDGVALDAPYRWTVIGDPATLNPALEIPGGALATLRTAGAEATTTEHDEVEVTAVREPSEPQYATPSDPDE
ncbi:uncharacterized protein YlxW (UPF0749 family) [Isoptericola jiangsuensis]|uniref:Uncharacterized protein YlxW (UPF0749 family) n=1 Tax=Isoptericola jiangsuensis TaxID=548579 RepID=A0A2A9EYA3_9MICO|nr:uncharacterized protein YlxW (UPF0749 family) [Isoptericola jiangsuensis]